MLVYEKLALVIPTLNEAACLPRILQETRVVLSWLGIPYEILVVDDESCDETQALAECLAAEDPRVRLLVRRGERGLAGAVLHGWRRTDASILGVMDADFQHPPGLLPALLGAMDAGADLALASRYLQGADTPGWNGLRRVISRLSTWLAGALPPPACQVKDPLSGYFLVRRQCVAQVAFRETGFKLLLEILMRGQVRRVSEVPFKFGRRRGGRSKAGCRVGWDYLLLLWDLYLARREASAMLAETSSD